MEAQRAVSEAQAPWKEMSAEELEKQYSPSRWVVRMEPEEALRTFWEKGTEATKNAQATRHCQLHVPYGDGKGDRMDIYFPDTELEALPFFLFYHGGYWQSGSKDQSAFMVNPLTTLGVAVAVVDYDVAPKGTLDHMVDQVARSIVFIQQRYPCNEGIYLCGHSAGAHLVSMMFLASWTEHGQVPNLRGFFLVSGLYDLEPIVSTSNNTLLLMTLEDARRNSPQRRLDTTLAWPADPACPILVMVGEHESPEFLRQSWEFCQTLCRGRWEASFKKLPDMDHFSIIENLTKKDSMVTQIVVKTIFQKL